MPIAPTYPGVYIEEVPSGVRTITGVATSLTAFIGRAKRGQVDESVTINSFADFERIFGGLWVDSTMSYAVRDFYLNGGSQAIIARLHNAATAATINLPTGAVAPDDLLPLVATNVGDWGNSLSVSVDYNTKDLADSNLFNLTVSEVDGTTEKFLNLSIAAADARYVPRVLEQSSMLVRVQKDGSDTRHGGRKDRNLCARKGRFVQFAVHSAAHA
jgi:phage tail sheath protein FI